MPSISIQQIEDGMILSAPLVGTTGNTILPKGAKLKKSLINRLSTWGIQSVSIEGEETQNPINLEELRQTILDLNLGKNEAHMQMLETLIAYRGQNS